MCIYDYPSAKFIFVCFCGGFLFCYFFARLYLQLTFLACFSRGLCMPTGGWSSPIVIECVGLESEIHLPECSDHRDGRTDALVFEVL